MQNDMLFYALAAAVFLLLGFSISIWLKVTNKQQGQNATDSDVEQLLKEKDEQIGKLREEKARVQAQLENQISQLEQVKTSLKETEKQYLEISNALATEKAESKGLREKLEHQKEEIKQLQADFKLQFQNLAHEILKQNTEEFSKTNREKLGELLNPLKEKIKQFEENVNAKYERELTDKASLRKELEMLGELNTKLAKEAQDLTQALRGDTKKQGDWGEIILERVLERSGLEKGREYQLQNTDQNSEGQTIRPDVVVFLPEEKHLIIDAKVSLTAYTEYVNAENEEGAADAAKKHLLSVKSHIKLLHEKNYSSASALNTPDFVLLFMPIEAAFSDALRMDADLFSYAWDKKIVLVSPTTLLATLRTIASIWKQEKQNRNAVEIAHQSGLLFDKFVNFLGDLEKIKKGIDSSNAAYELALNKLSTGKGNLIRRAEKIRELGANPSKNIPEAFIQNSDNEGDDED